MLTTQDISTATQDDDWLGYGYLGERSNRLTSTDPESPADPALVAQVDAALLDYANRQGWDYPTYLEWANSKLGRWFGDTMFGGRGPLADRFADALRFGLLRVPTG